MASALHRKCGVQTRHSHQRLQSDQPTACKSAPLSKATTYLHLHYTKDLREKEGPGRSKQCRYDRLSLVPAAANMLSVAGPGCLGEPLSFDQGHQGGVRSGLILWMPRPEGCSFDVLSVPTSCISFGEVAQKTDSISQSN